MADLCYGWQTEIHSEEHPSRDEQVIFETRPSAWLHMKTAAPGHGTIMLSTQGMGGWKVDVMWDAVPNPMSVRRKLQEAMDPRVGRSGERDGPSPHLNFSDRGCPEPYGKER
jgi:hypothetical protein